jgi:hypothetical protein
MPPNTRGLGVTAIKKQFRENGEFLKGTYRVERIEGTENINRRVIPKNIRDINIIRENPRIALLGWRKSRKITNDNYLDFVKKIMEYIKNKGERFLFDHKISIVLISKVGIGEQRLYLSTRYLKFNSAYEELENIITLHLAQYDINGLNIQKVIIKYARTMAMNEVYIYKGTVDMSDDIKDDIKHRMIINNKHELLKRLKKYYIWSPNTYKNCCIQACFMAKHKKKEIKNHTKKFIMKYNKNNDIVFNLETLAPLLTKYLKVNINAICINEDIEEYKYKYDDKSETINILVKGGHTYALIPKKDIDNIDNEEKDKTDEQILIEKPKIRDELSNYDIAVYDLETCNTEEEKKDKNNTTVYALGYYNGNEYKEIYKTEKEKDKNILASFIDYLYDVEKGNKVIYAHNGGKFDTYLLLKEILKSDKFSITSYLDSNGRILNMSIVQKGKKKPKKYVFRDSINLIAGSLDGACKSFKPKTKKLTGDVNHNNININNCHTKKIYDYTKEYLKNDCKSLYEILNMFDDTINDAYYFTIKDVMTNASIARRVFLDKYYDSVKKPLYTLDRETDRELRKFYFGGRNECMHKLGYHKGKFYYVDFTSLYPFVMMKNKYLYGKMNKIILKENTIKFNNKWFGFVKVMFRHKKKNKIPLHAVVKDNKLIFPFVDNWTESIICTEEIKYALKNDLGYEYKFIEVYNWKKKDNYFKPIIDELYKMKIEAQKSGNKALRQIAKIIINSTYGFFGINFLNRTQTKIINERCNDKKLSKEDKEEKIKDKRACRYFGFLMDQKLKDYQKAGEYDIYQIEDKIKAKCANVAIASMVTSYARLELYKLLKLIKEKEGNIYYMDTDSVITDYNIYDDIDFKHFIGMGGDNLGELTNEALDEYTDKIKELYINKIKEENPKLKNNKTGWNTDMIDEIYKKKYKKKVKDYINKTYKQNKKDFNKKKKTPHFKELITSGNKMYALRAEFNYNFEGEKITLKPKIMKMKGINSKQKYDKKEIDKENKIIYYKDINSHSGTKKIGFDDYKLMAQDYKIICDNMNFITGTREMLIKDKGLIKINNTKKIKSLYDKGILDENKYITPLII